MKRWKHTLDIKDSWAKTTNGEMSPKELAAVIAEKLKPIPNSSEQVAVFERLAQAADVSTDQFDAAFENLYNWADDRGVWVAAVF